MIDLSAGSGHYLGQNYSPRRLRALRRILIHRVFSILDRRFKRSEEINTLLARVFESDSNPSFIVLNWDIVLERHLEMIAGHAGITYCVNEYPWTREVQAGSMSRLIKVHGSANWVYCDNCRRVYFDRDQKLSLALKAGLSIEELSLFDLNLTDRDIPLPDSRCPHCGTPLGPHIATFSFRKSFRTMAFLSSWSAAEEALDKADRWLFVGYSLPDADYEFAHLLKVSELKLARLDCRSKLINAVVYNDGRAERKFRQLFGMAITHVDQGGLRNYVDSELDRFLA